MAQAWLVQQLARRRSFRQVSREIRDSAGTCGTGTNSGQQNSPLLLRSVDGIHNEKMPLDILRPVLVAVVKHLDTAEYTHHILGSYVLNYTKVVMEMTSHQSSLT